MRQLLIILSILMGLCGKVASSSNELTPSETTSALYKKIVNAQQYQRWKIILENLPKIKPGMTWHKVLGILGAPDGTEFCPPNVIQYSVDVNVKPKGKDGMTILITFSDSGKVLKVERVDFLYGPKPNSSI